ncbi:Alpha/Beta hydrolase protein [Podospora australis]|uniref:Alpha/Beta hydrolase protein n=1 Tax=Podospora australis TaxID=1536484 RepID=A0AAN6WPP1_9PEZI|nr:Alpha/Beta hydrolase protein [Podospora australis]
MSTSTPTPSDADSLFNVPQGFTDHSFRSKNGTELSVRVWPADPPVEGPAPFVLWTHGGGWLGGSHFNPLPWMAPGFRSRGYHLVSHNYRLAPQARIDEQLSDCLESVAWLHSNLGSILGRDKVDVDRYVLVGESAGGHLVTLMGVHLTEHPPRAIVDVYGLTDFMSLPAFCPEVPFNRWVPDAENPPPWKGEFSDEELDSMLLDRNPENLLTDACAWNELELIHEDELAKRWATDKLRPTRRIRLQAELHMRRSLNSDMEGLRKGVFHKEEFATIDEFVDFLRKMSPLRVLQDKFEKGTARQYPPTAFLHGSGDDTVLIDHSYRMAELLKKMGVPVVESYEDNEPHVFDFKYTGPNVAGWNIYIQPVLDFVDKYALSH